MFIVALKKNVLKQFATNECANATGAIDRLTLFSDAIHPFLKQNVVGKCPKYFLPPKYFLIKFFKLLAFHLQKYLKF